ncbi:MAG TPA: DUF3300 domain-containing protein [Terriglobales bacterium]|jgi:hypothetical protein|nr:DUF3300 domain-containing protein [Terriglobales bacterium]
MTIDVRSILYKLTAVLCSVLLLVGGTVSRAQQAAPQASPPAPEKIPNDQLDSLVAPIALYPDPLLAQVLAASTYPLELVQLQQWLEKNKNLKEKELTAAVEKQPWDPSVQAMAPFPDIVKQMVDGIQWTTDLGNAFLAQQKDVMDAVQRMRAKANEGGKLKSNDQVKVETKKVESKDVIVIEQSNPQVVYVPSYNPSVIWGPPAYPYPPVYYPPAGYYAAGMAISFGVGVAMGAAWGGGWGWGCGWGGNNDITVNRNNTFVNNSNRVNNVSNRQNLSNRSGNWQHNPQHRGGAPYSSQATANRFGGTTRGSSTATRQAGARQNQGQLANRQQSGSVGAGRQGASNFSGAGAGQQRGGSSSGGDRIGNRSVSPSSGSSSRGGGAFGGGSSFSGSAARSSSQRGSFSRGGGGSSRGGGRGRR